MQLKMLFSPIKIGSMEVRNRIVMPGMGTNLASPDGSPTDRQIAYYAARAEGGAGICCPGVTEVDPRGKGTGMSVAIWDDSLIPLWRKWADALHAHGAKLVPQLHHAGRETVSPFIGGLAPLAPSPIPCPVCKHTPEELTLELIWDIIEKFGEGARRAREAGCDAVELHGAHGYLIAQFMSPYSNKRTDEFGGSLQDRLKFPLEVIKSVRSRVGRDYPVIFRIVGEEMVNGGYTIEQTKIICRILVDAGVDAIHVSRGGGYGSIRWISPPHGVPMGLNAKEAAEIKSVINVPVIVAGRINDPLVAEQILEQGQADLVAVGRQFIADPDWPKKAAAGKFDDIIPCISCNQGCLLHVLTARPITCLVNPTVGKEVEMVIVPAKKPKKVLVAGGGPGGLEAARVAALRGHKVTLCEQTDRLGGQFNTAAIPPTKQELSLVVKYLTTQVKKAGVKIDLGKEVTLALVNELKPDVVIVATGATPLLPNLPGVNKPRVATAWHVLVGGVPLYHFDAAAQVDIGNKVVILGGGLVGCETADYCVELGCLEVTVIEMLPDVALDMPVWNKEFLTERLADKVNIITSATIKEILDDGVIYTKDGEEQTIRGMDNIILAMGAKPVNELSQKIKGKVAEIYVIGDAKEPRKALDAIAEAAEIAHKI